MQSTDSVGAFLLLSAVLYLVPVVLSAFFDRYLLPALPLLAAGLIAIEGARGGAWPGLRSVPMMAAATVVAGMQAYSVAGTHDYLAWNRARWSLVDELVTLEQVSPSSVDGGYEFNGRYTYTPDYAFDPEKSWWWVNDDVYVLAFGPIPGYVAIRHAPYSRWLLPRSQSSVVLLKRETPQESSQPSLRFDFVHGSTGSRPSQSRP
jgi:hypothetical protein